MTMHSNYTISDNSGGFPRFKYLNKDFGGFNNFCYKKEGTENRESAESLVTNYSLGNTIPGPWDYSVLITALQDHIAGSTDLSENIFPVELGSQ